MSDRIKDDSSSPLTSPENSDGVSRGETLMVNCGDSKYTVIQEADGRLHALRHGEKWRDCVGDNLILALAQELFDRQQENQQLQSRLEQAEKDRQSNGEIADRVIEENKSLKSKLTTAEQKVKELEQECKAWEESTRDSHNAMLERDHAHAENKRLREALEYARNKTHQSVYPLPGRCHCVICEALRSKQVISTPPPEDRPSIDSVFARCRVVYYPTDGSYPIEHSPHAQKDSKDAILTALAKEEKK